MSTFETNSIFFSVLFSIVIFAIIKITIMAKYNNLLESKKTLQFLYDNLKIKHEEVNKNYQTSLDRNDNFINTINRIGIKVKNYEDFIKSLKNNNQMLACDTDLKTLIKSEKENNIESIRIKINKQNDIDIFVNGAMKATDFEDITLNNNLLTKESKDVLINLVSSYRL